MMEDNPRIEELRRRVRMDPASIAFAALAEEYRRAGRFEAAIATCLAGLKRHPSYLPARLTLGRSLLAVGRHDDAQSEMEFALRLSPGNPAAIRGLAEIADHRLQVTGPPAPPDPIDQQADLEPLEDFLKAIRGARAAGGSRPD
jgi:tetratricopeptide (TPR) repeat protein